MKTGLIGARIHIIMLGLVAEATILGRNDVGDYLIVEKHTGLRYALPPDCIEVIGL